MKPPKKGWRRVLTLVAVDIPPINRYTTAADIRRDLREVYEQDGQGLTVRIKPVPRKP